MFTVALMNVDNVGPHIFFPCHCGLFFLFCFVFQNSLNVNSSQVKLIDDEFEVVCLEKQMVGARHVWNR